MPKISVLVLSALVYVPCASAIAAEPSGNAAQGAQAFRACAACHSLTPDRNMTGPSLAGLRDRKAGTLASFDRYSSALKASDVVWDTKTLGAWLANPAKFIPGNHMTFPGIRDAKVRRDLIAFLNAQSIGKPPVTSDEASGIAGMVGGMAPQMSDLKKVAPENQVRAIRYCRDSYYVTTADGNVADFWEPNLRFKTDSSANGPNKDAPAIMPAGMMGDRASVIFAAPEEISTSIKQQC